VAATPGLNIFIGNGAIHFQFRQCDSPSVEKQCIASPTRAGSGKAGKAMPKNISCTMYRLDMDLVGANKHYRQKIKINLYG